MTSRPRINVARIYTDLGPDDDVRVLVDRMWPRGFRKGDPRVGRWMPKVAPSAELRRWYSHEPERFDAFAARYAEELTTEEGAAALAELREMVRDGRVTLVTAARDLDGSHFAVLARLLA
jgi:uncharacterized protein YeaO (DUF488 family)